MDNIIRYFEGEKWQCTVGMVVSIVFIALSVYFLVLQKPMLKGMAFASLPLSILLLAICIGITARVPKDIARVSALFESGPQHMRTDELPRMEKVMRNFSVIKTVEICLIVVGVLLVLVFWNTGLLKGIGIGLVVQGVLLYGFDHFAQARGRIYVEFLNSL